MGLAGGPASQSVCGALLGSAAGIHRGLIFLIRSDCLNIARNGSGVLQPAASPSFCRACLGPAARIHRGLTRSVQPGLISCSCNNGWHPPHRIAQWADVLCRAPAGQLPATDLWGPPGVNCVLRRALYTCSCITATVDQVPGCSVCGAILEPIAILHRWLTCLIQLLLFSLGWEQCCTVCFWGYPGANCRNTRRGECSVHPCVPSSYHCLNAVTVSHACVLSRKLSGQIVMHKRLGRVLVACTAIHGFRWFDPGLHWQQYWLPLPSCSQVGIAGSCLLTVLSSS